MSNIILGEQQEKALSNIIEFLSSEELSFSLIGYAGTGKSLLIKYIIDYLEKNFIMYTLCAPTHKAKIVLEKFTDREGVTLHKLLSLSPNIQIMDLDLRDLRFSMGGRSEDIPIGGVILCDESSMINDDLFNMLIDKCRAYNCKLITIGDKAQLKPVKASEHSKVFDNENKYSLTKIYRQKGDIGYSDLLNTLRNDSVDILTDSIGIDGSLNCYTDVKEFFTEALPYFKKAIKNSDILETKILAYTNNRVRAFNQKMKETLFGDKEYSKFEILTGYENLEFNGTKFWNSLDYIIIDEPRKGEMFIPSFIKLPGYYLNLYNTSNKCTEEIFILSKDISKDYLNSLAYLIETTRLDAIAAKKRNHYVGNKKWSEYFSIIQSFTSPVDLFYGNRLVRKKSFDYGYASTAHKSQGSSINNVFIDMKNIKQCRDSEELRQMQYVAISRAKENVFILQ